MRADSTTRSPGSEIVVVGTSLGGLEALQRLLAGLPAGFPTPMAIVQHRSAEPDGLLIEQLQEHSKLPVSEPEDKEAILPGRVYVAPANYHLLLDFNAKAQSRQGAKEDQKKVLVSAPLRLCVEKPSPAFALSVDEPVNYARPSIDVLFESAAHAYGEKVIAIVLTGASKDGAAGAGRVRQCGGSVLVQDPATAESRVMPEAAIAATKTDKVMTLAAIAEFLRDHARRDFLHSDTKSTS